MNREKVAEIYFEIGNEQYYRYQPIGWENAIWCYDLAVKLNPNEMKYFSMLIQSYISIKKYYTLNLYPEKKYNEKAINILDKALKLHPENENLIITLSHLYYADNKYKLSKNALFKLNNYNTLNKIDNICDVEIKVINDKKVKTNFFALLIYMKLYKIYDENFISNIKNNFTKAQNSYLYYIFATNCMKYGMYEKAVEMLKISLEYKIDNAFSYNKLGLCYYYMGRYNSAIDFYKSAVNILPDFVKAYSNIGKARMALNNLNGAEEIFKKAILINPYIYTVYNDLGVIYYKNKMYKVSIEVYKKAIELNPFYYIAHNNLGISLKEINNYNESEQAYRKAIELNPRYAQAYNNLGTLLNKLKRYDEAIECYKSALHINPKYKNAYMNLEKVYELIESNNLPFV